MTAPYPHAIPLALSSETVDLVTGLVWPALIAVVVWRLFPLIREIIRSRGFTISAGGMEISVQQASEQLASRLEDVREQVSALKADASAAPIAEGVPKLSHVVWVDDHPENNAFEVQTLKRKGVEVRQARSTAEALDVIENRAPVGAVISDMGRTVDGPDAGLELLRTLRERGNDVPFLIYASAAAVARTRGEATGLGAHGVTSSATELLDLLGRLGLRS